MGVQVGWVCRFLWFGVLFLAIKSGNLVGGFNKSEKNRQIGSSPQVGLIPLGLAEAL